MLDTSLQGRVALVTGGSRGIGRATAQAFARAGATMAIGYRDNEAAAHETLALLEREGVKAVAVRADVASAEGCQQLHAEVERTVGRVDILVNNAGHHENDVFLALDDASFLRLYETHVLSVTRLVRQFAPAMMARKWGRILNISSVAASKPTVGQANYAVAKAGVEALTRCLAIELHKRQITVNCISPGLIDTDMVKDADSGYVLAHQLVKRLGKADEIAGWLLMLASKYGDYVTGRVFDLDGGFMLV